MPTFAPLFLIILSSMIAAASGLPLLIQSVPEVKGQKMSAMFMIAAAVTGVSGSITVLISRICLTHELSWSTPYGPMICAVDPLSAFFMLPLLIIPACCSVYALGYWRSTNKPRNFRMLHFFFGLLVSGLIWITLARSAILFLFAWEIMAVSAFYIITPEDNEKEVRDSGILYMICTHISTLSLFAVFAVLKTQVHTFIFPATGSLSADSFAASAIFITAFLGFGIKAGMMPFHVWLPSAHANAPSHISAVMSGVILKIGIYGLFRILTFFDNIPVWWGVTVLAAGVISGIMGVIFAIGQHDIKRLLAYHSIENIGIILMGAGVGLLGLSAKKPSIVVLGMAGALLHVLNHAIFKALLFFGAGSVIHSLGTREIDRMGGLQKKMPLTAFFFFTGAVAISGLPPLNGFISEMFIYLGLFNNAIQGQGPSAGSSALATPALALIGGLALACFVKVFGIIFLGEPRTQQPSGLHEVPRSMISPMALLCVLCILIGIFPSGYSQLIESAVASFSSTFLNDVTLASLSPLDWISGLSISLGILIFLVFSFRIKRIVSTWSNTWSCGYLSPTSRMQYTASSFAQTLNHLFKSVLLPRTHRPVINSSFPGSSCFEYHVPETALEKFYFPFFSSINDKLSIIRKLQNGKMHYYLFYMFSTLMILLLTPFE